MINGGVGSATHRLAKNLACAGLNIHIVAPGQNQVETSVIPTWEEGVTIHRTFPELGSPYGDPLPLSEIGEYIIKLHEKVGFDVVHGIFLVSAGLVGAIAAGEINRPLITSIRGSDIQTMRYSSALSGTIRWVLENASLVTSVTHDLMEKAKRIADIQASRVVPNAFDSKIFDPWPLREVVLNQRWQIRLFVEKFLRTKARGGSVVGTSGIFRHVKGFSALLEAFGELLNIDSDACLLLVGDFAGPREQKMWTQKIKEMRLKKRVFITGRVPHQQVLAWMREMDIFAFPSLHEGSPNALLEAMACRLPIVASRVGGVLDIISDGVNGLLINPGCKEHLLEKLSVLVQDRDLRKRLGKAAGQSVEENFSPGQETAMWIDIYSQVSNTVKDSILKKPELLEK